MILPGLLLTLNTHLESGEGCTIDSLSSPDHPLSSEVRFGS